MVGGGSYRERCPGREAPGDEMAERFSSLGMSNI